MNTPNTRQTRRSGQPSVQPAQQPAPQADPQAQAAQAMSRAREQLRVAKADIAAKDAEIARLSAMLPQTTPQTNPYEGKSIQDLAAMIDGGDRNAVPYLNAAVQALANGTNVPAPPAFQPAPPPQAPPSVPTVDYSTWSEDDLLNALTEQNRPDLETIEAEFLSRQPGGRQIREREDEDRAKRARAYYKTLHGPNSVAPTGKLADEVWEEFEAFEARTKGTAQQPARPNGAMAPTFAPSQQAPRFQPQAQPQAQPAGFNVRSTATTSEAAIGSVQPTQLDYDILARIPADVAHFYSRVNPKKSTKGNRVPGFQWASTQGNPNSAWAYVAFVDWYMEWQRTGTVNTTVDTETVNRGLAVIHKDPAKYANGLTEGLARAAALQVAWLRTLGIPEASILNGQWAGRK